MILIKRLINIFKMSNYSAPYVPPIAHVNTFGQKKSADSNLLDLGGPETKRLTQ